MTIYLHYDQSELDRQYTQGIWATNADEIIAWYGARSAEIRAGALCRLDVPYGPTPEEKLDIFLTERPGSPVHVYVHGGAWQILTKAESCFAADVLVGAGAHVVVLDFASIPVVRLPEMVAQVRRGIAWVCANAASFGGDPARVFVCGHSSGAHLVAAALTAPAAVSGGLSPPPVAGALCASGSYDLEPVQLSHRGAYLGLNAREIEAFSPIRNLAALKTPLIVAHGGKESAEFRRQSTSFADALQAAGHAVERIFAPDLNHFEISMTLAQPDGVLARAALRQMGLGA